MADSTLALSFIIPAEAKRIKFSSFNDEPVMNLENGEI